MKINIYTLHVCKATTCMYDGCTPKIESWCIPYTCVEAARSRMRNSVRDEVEHVYHGCAGYEWGKKRIEKLSKEILEKDGDEPLSAYWEFASTSYKWHIQYDEVEIADPVGHDTVMECLGYRKDDNEHVGE